MTATIFELKVDLRYPGLTFADEDAFLFPEEGRVRAMQRLAPSFEVMPSDEEVDPHKVEFPDLVSFSPGFCCFSDKAWSLIQSNLAVRGDTATLVYARVGFVSEFILFEPTRWFHCLDFERSKVRRFDVPPHRVMWVDDLVLRDTAAVDEDIFRVEHLPARIFCTARCVELVKKCKLTGFKFERVTMTE